MRSGWRSWETAWSEAVGYRAEASFSKVFKRLLGVPPATFRRRSAPGPSQRASSR